MKTLNIELTWFGLQIQLLITHILMSCKNCHGMWNQKCTPLLIKSRRNQHLSEFSSNVYVRGTQHYNRQIGVDDMYSSCLRYDNDVTVLVLISSNWLCSGPSNDSNNQTKITLWITVVRRRQTPNYKQSRELVTTLICLLHIQTDQI